MNNTAPRTATILVVAACFVGILCVGCSQELPSPQKGIPPASAYEIDRERLTHFNGAELPGGAKQLEFAESFERSEGVANSLRNADGFKTYEGLPHFSWEPELFKAELQAAKTVEIAGWPFYAEPVVVGEKRAQKLVELITDKDFLVPFRGFKSCGGFHPDWVLVWHEGGTAYSAMICLGCSELQVHADQELVLYCDLWDNDYAKGLLTPLRTQRPK